VAHGGHRAAQLQLPVEGAASCQRSALAAERCASALPSRAANCLVAGLLTAGSGREGVESRSRR